MFRELLPQAAGRDPFEAVDQCGELNGRWIVNQKVYVVGFAVELGERCAELVAHLCHDRFASCQHRICESSSAIFGDKDQVRVEVVHNATTPSYIGV